MIQDVTKDANATSKGTDDLYGPVSFDQISYSNLDLAKRINYGEQGTEKVVYWVDGTTLYGPIPDDAENSVALEIDGVTYNAGDIKYGTATDAQRKAAQGDTDNSVWKWTDTNGIVDPDPAAKGKTYDKVIGTTADVNGDAKYYEEVTDPNTGAVTRNHTKIPSGLGVYYADERTFTYVIWEVKDAADWGLPSRGQMAARLRRASPLAAPEPETPAFSATIPLGRTPIGPTRSLRNIGSTPVKVTHTTWYM